MPAALVLRGATPADHGVYARLFDELGLADPPTDRERFARELCPGMLMAAVGEEVVGYATARILLGTAHLVQMVVAPEARRRGVASALLHAVAEQARAAGCASWTLNVKPDNTGAIALYQRHGFVVKHRSDAIVLPWSAVPALPASADDVIARPITPADEARVESLPSFPPGMLRLLGRMRGRALVLVEGRGGGEVLAAAVFDPDFPGASPFHAAAPPVVRPLLEALRPHARHDQLLLFVEGQPEIAAALLAAGGCLQLHVLKMAAPLHDEPQDAPPAPPGAYRAAP